jgi:ell wall binding domain 2 (CWB2)
MVRRAMPRALVLPLCLLALAAAGCGGKAATTADKPTIGVKGTETQAAQGLGFPAIATKNTTRVGGADAVADAAGVAQAVFPGTSRASRPGAVTLVPKDDWRAGIAASALMARPIAAPILLSDATSLPPGSASALKALAPTGSRKAGGAQIIRVGEVAQAGGLKTTDIRGADPFSLGHAIDAFLTAARGKSSDHVLIASADRPAFAMPAAAYAAKSGDPVLFVNRDTLPAQTRAAIAQHQQPKIYVLGPESVIGAKVERALRKLGKVVRISGPDPQTATAAAPLSATGTYGPLLLVSDPAKVDDPLSQYLLDIQPGYAKDPVRGVYNHGWIIGDEKAVSIAAQSQIDRLLEISPVSTKNK